LSCRVVLVCRRDLDLDLDDDFFTRGHFKRVWIQAKALCKKTDDTPRDQTLESRVHFLMNATVFQLLIFSSLVVIRQRVKEAMRASTVQTLALLNSRTLYWRYFVNLISH
jgi:hypothetical protein